MLKLGNNFEETFELFGEDKVPIDVFRYIATIVFEDDSMINVEKIVRQFNNPKASEPYEYTLGGDFFLVETFEDLKEIKGTVENKDTETWFSIFERADSFDICEYMPVTDAKRFVVVFTATNNSGGPMYFIPENICTRTVIESIALTRKFWSNNANHT